MMPVGSQTVTSEPASRAMFSIPHMIIIFVVVLIVFGPQKLPELARGLGKLMAEFRKASGDFKSAFEQEMRDMERQTMLAERKKQAEAAAASAAAEPATLATTPGVDIAVPVASPDGAPADTRETEAAVTGPVITPVPESIPRSTEDSTVAHGSPEPAPEASSTSAHDAHS
jgi:sec-independent protein translocase protein TatB